MERETALGIKRLWGYRSLILTLSVTDMQMRYKNTVLGLFWSMIEPLLLFTVLYLVFTFLRQRTENFELFLFIGIIAWRLFSSGTTLGMTSVSNKKNIISRVAIPLEVPVLSSLLVSLMTICFPLIVYFAVMAAVQFVPPLTIFLFPLVFLLLGLLVLGLSLPLAALSPLYEDIKQIWTIITVTGFFVTPIFYSIDNLPPEVRQWFFINPVTGLLTLSRSLMLGTPLPIEFPWLYTIAAPFVILVLGYAIFRKYSPKILEA